MNVSLRIFSIAIALTGAVAEARLWTNDEGQTLEAELVRVRGRTAFLKSANGEIPAPIARLSEEDQAYIEQYKVFRRTREWGTGVRGRFFKVDDTSVRVLRGTDLSGIPFERLSPEDVLHVVGALEHAGETPPAALQSAVPKSTGTEFVATGDEPVRSWKNANGKVIEAAFLGTTGERAVLAMRGKQYRVPIASLSSEDQAWIASRGLEDLGGSGQRVLSAFGQIAGAAMMRAGGPPPMPPPQFNQPPGSLGQGLAAPTIPTEPPAAAVAVEPPPAAEQPVVDEYRVPQPTPVEEPTSPVNASPPAPDPTNGRGEPPWISTIDDLSLNEQERRYKEAFGDWVDNDEEAEGDAYCSHCDAEFLYPASFTAGDGCPFCGVAMQADDLTSWEEYEDEYNSRPWYTRRWTRRIVIFLVISAIGAGVKVMTGGE